MFKSSVILAAAAISAVQAQNFGALANDLNPSLSSNCLQTLYTASGAVQGYCGISNAASLIAGNATGVAPILNAVYYVANNSTTLNTTCGDACGTYLDQFAYTVLNSCGNTTLLKPSADGNITVTGSDLVNILRYARRAVCIPGSNDTPYCVQSQLDSYARDFPNPANTTYSGVLNDTNITCQACTRDQITQLQNTTSLSPYWQNVAEGYVNDVSNAVNSSCPAPMANMTKREVFLHARTRLHKLM